MRVGIGGCGVVGRPDINFGTDIGISFDWSVIVSDSVFCFWGVLTSHSFSSWLDPTGIDKKFDEDIDIETEDKCGIGHLSADLASVLVKGPCYEHEGNNGMMVPLDTPVRVGRRANAVDFDCESDASGPSEPEGLTDSSS